MLRQLRKAEKFTFTFTLVKVGKILEGYRANYKLKILTKYKLKKSRAPGDKLKGTFKLDVFRSQMGSSVGRLLGRDDNKWGL